MLFSSTAQSIKIFFLNKYTHNFFTTLATSESCVENAINYLLVDIFGVTSKLMLAASLNTLRPFFSNLLLAIESVETYTSYIAVHE